jgi:hypothetical protein
MAEGVRGKVQHEGYEANFYEKKVSKPGLEGHPVSFLPPSEVFDLPFVATPAGDRNKPICN